MEYLGKVFRSRTVWTIVLMFIVGGFQAIEGTLNPQIFMFVQAGLSFLAVHFRMSPSQNYN